VDALTFLHAVIESNNPESAPPSAAQYAVLVAQNDDPDRRPPHEEDEEEDEEKVDPDDATKATGEQEDEDAADQVHEDTNTSDYPPADVDSAKAAEGAPAPDKTPSKSGGQRRFYLLPIVEGRVIQHAPIGWNVLDYIVRGGQSDEGRKRSRSTASAKENLGEKKDLFRDPNFVELFGQRNDMYVSALCARSHSPS
jgi:hypothetical protein